ncbi:MAG: hypothetical protein AB8B48_13635 [Pseudomonadales bacterium]
MSKLETEFLTTVAEESRKPANWPLACALLLLRGLGALPFPFNVRLGKAIGQFLYLIPSSRKHVTKVNIDLCFPELNAEEKRRFCKEVFKNFGAGLAETSMAWWSSHERIQSISEIEGLDILLAAKEKGKGVLLLGAHFSTLDIGAAIGSNHFPFSAVYRPQRNALFNATMLAGRDRHAETHIKKTNPRALIKAVRRGEIVWYGPDQDEGENNSVYAPFFSQTASTINATATLARITGAPVLLYGQRRKPDDSGYIVSITGPLKDFPSGNDVIDAAAVNALIETAIRNEPTQYYWFHRRFKTQANQERGALYKR